ncbi:MAG TPA: purine-nucleoside phosphorylase [Chloroflexi bacterium]|nr:purine-nucleoside phosphorylase [Chloroflexota bacterium]
MSVQKITLTVIEEAAEAVRRRLTTQPGVGLILGSGLNGVAEAVEAEAILPYSEIPHFPQATVEGHAGRLVIGRLEGQDVVVMQGRAHYYEGYSMAQVTLPVRVMQLLGVGTLIVTNAAGGLNPAFRPGDVMVIRDHINLVGMAGLNPLRGPNLDRFGPRFPDMSCAYDPDLRAAARAVAEREGIPVHEGVYICLAGPSFETPADIRFLRIIGADAVGMSTVPEVTVARHGGMRVLGLSGISNVAISEEGATQETTHEEVLEAGRLLAPRMEAIIRGVLRRL